MLDLYARAGVFVLATLVLGLFLSAITHTQSQAFQLTFMSFLPQLLLCFAIGLLLAVSKFNKRLDRTQPGKSQVS